jgi:hypothetical protein
MPESGPPSGFDELLLPHPVSIPVIPIMQLTAIDPMTMDQARRSRASEVDPGLDR